MTNNRDIALILKELLKWDGLIEDTLHDSDYEGNKEYDFDADIALKKIKAFIKENL